MQILCTRPMDEQLIAEANEMGIDIDVLSFIETEPIETVEVQQEIETVLNSTATVVFTSANAVDAVAMNLVDEMPEWNIYCIGNTTKDMVQRYFSASVIARTAENAEILAEFIVEDAPESVVFFCGDRRRDELPALLRQHNIEVDEIVVYLTIAVPHKLTKHYHGILFFSPSAVESFLLYNSPAAETVLFAIGNTTAEVIRKHSSNKVITAGQPGKAQLFEKMIEYFT